MLRSIKLINKVAQHEPGTVLRLVADASLTLVQRGDAEFVPEEIDLATKAIEPKIVNIVKPKAKKTK